MTKLERQGGGGGGCQTNQYWNDAAASVASCRPGTATGCCGSPNSCVDCSGNCYASGVIYGTSRAGDVKCENGRWKLAVTSYVESTPDDGTVHGYPASEYPTEV